ncbi:CoA transferase [Enterovirga sp.]|jgi:crotonobetainyl-CoA:carnitine CoA-transferase CaiB-like acyl-CoA transferase|uniref:CaiB/BaiF CoA transferase family protein n=1 Tax=Enterovirga sp. TaxID=2026350 RepID=UPI00262084B6|nr:CoA transferase [Enterovirga sp.]MDB5591228.1 CoA-transferase [Enterovirga sp.]
MKLEGLLVLDLSRFLPGPYIAMCMADHGAEVIKIESRDGEPTRTLGPDVGGQTVYFRNTQRGKKSCELDLKSEAGLAAFHELARRADVIVESFRPGVARRLGIDYEAIRAINPRIVYCALSAFGQTGPRAQRPSHDLGAQAISGVLSLARGTDGRPVMPALPMADISLALTGLSAILMALLRRGTTGEGDFIDVSMLDTLMTWTAPIAHDALGSGTPPRLETERLYGGAAFYNIYETADGKFLVLSGSEHKFAETLLTALGRPDLVGLCRQPAGPVQDPVRAFLTETFRTRSRDEWDAYLSQLDVCYAPVNDLAEGLLQPTLREREMILEEPDGTLRIGTPFKFAREPGRVATRGPSQGEHTAEVIGR